MITEFQANAVTKVNGFVIKMLCDPFINKITVSTTRIACGTSIDMTKFSYEDPADVAAAFAKYSMSVTWAVTSNLNECDKVTANGM